LPNLPRVPQLPTNNFSCLLLCFGCAAFEQPQKVDTLLELDEFLRFFLLFQFFFGFSNQHRIFYSIILRTTLLELVLLRAASEARKAGFNSTLVQLKAAH
jgi:hypothetical protein